MMSDSIEILDAELKIIGKTIAGLKGQIEVKSEKFDSIKHVLDFNIKRYEVKSSKYATFDHALLIGSIISVFLISIGFVKWYDLQTMIDKQLSKTHKFVSPEQKRRSSLVKLIRKVGLSPKRSKNINPRQRLL